jgi:hypothetical protein
MPKLIPCSNPLSLVFSLILLLLPVFPAAQTEIYKPYKVGLWTADTLYVGASFLYLGGGGDITVTLGTSESATTGKLYAINPAKNDTLYLFSNKDALGTSVNISKLTTVPVGGTLIFMYIPQNNDIPMFTGPNLIGDRYFSSESSDDMPKPNWRYGHRWSVVGKTKGGDLEFGFEDWASPMSDMDFDDVIFKVKGMSLGIFTRSLRARDFVR